MFKTFLQQPTQLKNWNDMRVLAIDPGYDRLGIAVLDNHSGSDELLYSNCITSSPSDPLPERLVAISKEFSRVLDEFKPDSFSLETLFFNKNIKTAMSVAQARGVFLYLAKLAKCEIYEFSPQQIKVAVTGHGGSDKTAVTMMVKRLVKNPPSAALDDEYDAIAVGITCLATYGRSR